MSSKLQCSLLLAVLSILWAGPAWGITYDISLDPGQEIPVPNVAGFSPSGTATVDVNTITGAVTVNGSYAGMTSNVAAAHLHGLTDPLPTAGVIFGFTVDGGTSGNFTGSSTLDATNLQGLLDGRTYLNVHTANNMPGEIRGDVADPDIRVFNLELGPGQEVPAPNIAGFSPSGAATVVVDTSSGEVEISGSYAGMTSDVIAAHLHGLTDPDPTAGVIFGFTVDGGTSGNFSGSSTLSPENLAGLLAGRTYLNVHTANNMPGEIRADVIPEPSTLLLAGLLTGLLVIRLRG